MIPDIADIHTVDSANIDCSYSYIVSTQQESMNFIDSVKSISESGLYVLNHHMQLDNQDIINNQCAICLDIINEQDETCILDCFHFFHNKCILEYRKVNSSCPTCRHKYKNVVSHETLEELFYNSILTCQNKDCFYNITLAQAKKINKIATNSNSKLWLLSPKSLDKIKQIIVADIKSTFVYEDSFTDNIPHLQNCIKKIKISIKNEENKKSNEFFKDYTKHYSCPYPVSNFYNQETANFLKNNSTIVLPIIKKIFIKNLRGREEITEYRFNETEENITIVVNNCIFTYKNDNKITDSRTLFLNIIDECISDSLLLKFKVDNPKIFNTSKSSYIKDWDTSENKLNIVNNGEDISIPINYFIDYQNNKLDNYKFKKAISDAQVDYSNLHAPIQDTPANNTQNPLENTQQTINIHDLCDFTIIVENGCITFTYKITIPYPGAEISWNFHLGFNRVD